MQRRAGWRAARGCPPRSRRRAGEPSLVGARVCVRRPVLSFHLLAFSAWRGSPCSCWPLAAAQSIPPMRDPPERGVAVVDVGSLAVTWGGHATALIELDGVRLLTDPVLNDRIGPLRRIASPVDRELGERIDAVMLSHLHADHAELRSLRGLGAATIVFAPRGAARWLTRHGVRNVEELSPGQEARLGAVRITATPARHGRR